MNKKIILLSVALTAAFPLSSVMASQIALISTDTTNTNVSQIPNGDDSQVKPSWKMQRQENEQLRAQNQQERDQIKGERQQLNSQAQETRQQNVSARCQNIQGKISSQLGRLNSDKQAFAASFADMQARLQRLSDHLGVKNFDVTKLNQDITTLGTKIAQLKKDHDALVAQLSSVQSTAATDCGTTQGAFMTQMQTARTAALTVQQDRLDVRSFYQTSIRPDLMAIRAQIAKTESSSSTSSDSASNSTKLKLNKK